MHFKNTRNYLSISISTTFSVPSSIHCPWTVLPCPVCRLPRKLVASSCRPRTLANCRPRIRRSPRAEEQEIRLSGSTTRKFVSDLKKMDQEIEDSCEISGYSPRLQMAAALAPLAPASRVRLAPAHSPSALAPARPLALRARLAPARCARLPPFSRARLPLV